QRPPRSGLPAQRRSSWSDLQCSVPRSGLSAERPPRSGLAAERPPRSGLAAQRRRGADASAASLIAERVGSAAVFLAERSSAERTLSRSVGSAASFGGVVASSGKA